MPTGRLAYVRGPARVAHRFRPRQTEGAVPDTIRWSAAPRRPERIHASRVLLADGCDGQEATMQGVWYAAVVVVFILGVLFVAAYGTCLAAISTRKWWRFWSRG